MPTKEEQEMIQKGLAASQIVLFGPIVPLFLMQDRLRPGEGPPGGWGNRGDGGDHGGDYRPPEDDYEMPDYEVPDWGDYVPPEWPSRRLQDFDNSDFIPFGDPSLVTDIILASFIATFFYSVSVFCDFEKATNLKLALLSATLLFFAMVDGFNAIRAQDRFGSHYDDTKKGTSARRHRRATAGGIRRDDVVPRRHEGRERARQCFGRPHLHPVRHQPRAGLGRVDAAPPREEGR